MQEGLKKNVQTVLGTIDADSLGTTLVHEHLLIDMTGYFVPPVGDAETKLAHQKVNLENLYWVRLNPVSNLDNLKLWDKKLVVKECEHYKAAGGNTIVEVSTPPVGRDPRGLVSIARATGLNVVMGAGFHTARSHPPDLASRSEEEITEELVKEITVGADGTGVRAGIIGEIGCSAPLAEGERKVLRCCGAAQRRTGVAVYIHPSPADDLALEIPKILSDAGADLSRVVIGHIDISGFSGETCRKFLEMGCYIAYDTFGFEGFIRPPHEARVMELSDAQRIKDLIRLIADGYLNKILISQDVATKERLASFAGFGYAHILRDLLPIMRVKGISDEQIHALLVDNPKHMLSSGPVAGASNN
jgi:phosphotriesterase-related protein